MQYIIILMELMVHFKTAMSFQDTIDNSIKYDMLQAADFLGYIISYDYSPTLCDEPM